jgi:hypothetical protein
VPEELTLGSRIWKGWAVAVELPLLVTMYPSLSCTAVAVEMPPEVLLGSLIWNC